MTASQVEKLAETLKRQGLASSMTEALEKARNIIGVSIGQEIVADDDSEALDASKSLNELLGEAGVNSKELTAQEKQIVADEIEHIKSDIKEIRRDIKKPQVPTEKIIEKMHQVVEEIDDLAEFKQELSDSNKE